MSRTDVPQWGADLQSEHTFEAAWRMPADIERLFRDVAADGYTLNLCAGELDVGDVLVDADPQLKRAIPADMRALPFDDAVFDAVLFDPPWKLGYYRRQRPFFEAVRVCKPGGLILANALWVGESDQTRIEPPLLIRADDPWGNISAIVAHRKAPGQAELDQWGAGVDAVPTRPNPAQWLRCETCGNRVRVGEVVESAVLDPGTFCSWSCLREAEAHLLRPEEDPTQPPDDTRAETGSVHR